MVLAKNTFEGNRAPELGLFGRIQSQGRAGPVWTEPEGTATIATVPRINLTSTELMDVARALKLLARQAQADAEKQGGSSSRHLFVESAKRHLQLAGEFEAAWRAEQKKVE